MHKGDDIITTFIAGSVFLMGIGITMILFLSWIFS